MSGVKASRLSSIPANMVSQLDAESAISEPVIIVMENMMYGNLRRGMEVRGL